MCSQWHCAVHLAFFSSLLLACTAFREGEFITTARKSQYHEVRTQWHDLLGNHCPRFGLNRLVALPLPKPHAAFEHGKEVFKMQLSFDGDRHITPWLKIMGAGAPLVPVLHVELRRAGEEVLGVTAKVTEAPVSYLHMHNQLVEEFKNASHWPKHLLIRYEFKTEHEVDLDRGLYLLMAFGLLSMLILVINAANGAQSKLAQFLQDMATDDAGVMNGGTAGPSGWKGLSKAE